MYHSSIGAPDGSSRIFFQFPLNHEEFLGSGRPRNGEKSFGYNTTVQKAQITNWSMRLNVKWAAKYRMGRCGVRYVVAPNEKATERTAAVLSGKSMMRALFCSLVRWKVCWICLPRPLRFSAYSHESESVGFTCESQEPTGCRYLCRLNEEI